MNELQHYNATTQRFSHLFGCNTALVAVPCTSVATIAQCNNAYRRHMAYCQDHGIWTHERIELIAVGRLLLIDSLRDIAEYLGVSPTTVYSMYNRPDKLTQFKTRCTIYKALNFYCLELTTNGTALGALQFLNSQHSLTEQLYDKRNYSTTL